MTRCLLLVVGLLEFVLVLSTVASFATAEASPALAAAKLTDLEKAQIEFWTRHLNDSQSRKVQIRLMAAVMNRLAAIMEAEERGQDVRTDLERAKDDFVARLYRSERFIQSEKMLVQRMTEFTPIFFETQWNNDSIWQALKLVDSDSAADPDYAEAAKKLMLAVAQRDASGPKLPIEQAVEDFHSTLKTAPEYTQAWKKLLMVRPNGPGWWLRHVAPCESASCLVAAIRLEQLKRPISG